LGHCYRPRLEWLEARVQLGDTLLGLSALALAELGASSLDAPLAAGSDTQDRIWQHSLFADFEAVSSRPAGSLGLDSRTDDADSQTNRDVTVTAPPTQTALVSFLPNDADDQLLAAQVAIHRLARSASRPSPAVPVSFGMCGAGGGAATRVAGADTPVAFVGNSNAAGHPAQLVAAGAALSFDASTGQLAIRTDAGNHSVREAPSPDGFVDVTVDGQAHSSNPRSASFDSALAGATGSTLTGIRFAGGAQDTLTVGSQQLAGGLTVQATGATVVTENVVTAGPLAIQAPNITVSGTLEGSRVALAASGWVTVNATGRIQAAASASVCDIVVSAERFVNSGELHADGLSGGAIVVQANAILNAGPITADASGDHGGQVDIAFTQSYLATAAAEVSANNAAGPAGQVTIDGGSSGRLYSSGRHSATGSVGGAVALLGREVVLVGAAVDASGEAGGGTVRIGGDFQGRNPAVGNAQTVTVTGTTTLRADALRQGKGGRVTVWADAQTSFAGTVSARGGPAGGAGGLIEVSGRGNLDYAGTVDASAVSGLPGTLRLDPKNLVISAAPDGIFPQYDLIDPHPTARGSFGNDVEVLSNGNLVVTNWTDDFGGTQAGAAYLFNGVTGALLSALVGSSPYDTVGASIALLSNGNYLVQSPYWNSNRGAVTWCNPTTGVSGIVSEANSLVGSSPGDQVGFYNIFRLSNGNYVVPTPTWGQQRGAVTWANGITGLSGIVSEANSLVGSSPGDRVGEKLFPLSNGNYVVVTRDWNHFRGAVTWANSSAPITGSVSEGNSLVGSNDGDQVGMSDIVVLSNGNYVIPCWTWNGNRGAVTWGSGTTGVSGIVSEANSLVGSNPGDAVGSQVIPLSNGNYVVTSGYAGRGAVTWGNGNMGTSGSVSEANSLVGSNPNDGVGSRVTPLTNGNYVVDSRFWNAQRGAVTWESGTTGIRGIVSETNSLVGSNPGDYVGNNIIALSNGNYVVTNPYWNSQRGAATWGNGSTGTSGTISEANSLIGSSPNDLVGNFFGITPLSNGNYVVVSPYWNGNRGAVTWGNGSTGISGTVSDSNSLVGSNPGTGIPFGDYSGDVVGLRGVTALNNGNYVVGSPQWNSQRGAATWGDGNAGIRGTIAETNSLIGSDPNDGVGEYGVTLLNNGNYVVQSPGWHGAGAVTWGDGSSGVRGIVSPDNSLVGSHPRDGVGSGIPGGFEMQYYPGIIPLSNGNFAVYSPNWNAGRGAVTWGSGTAGTCGIVSDANSLVGSDPRDLLGIGGIDALSDGNYVVGSLLSNGMNSAVTWVNGTIGQTLDAMGTITPQNSLPGGFYRENPVDHTLVVSSFMDRFNQRLTIGLTDPNELTFARASSQTLTVTPTFLTQTLDSGTAVVLQASNDITVNSPITVSAGGQGGALTLQAGRSLVLNASITTDNGPLLLIANDQVVNGVVDAERDPGSAVISMAPGTALDTGSGPLTVELRDGAGLTNSDSGAITLQSVTAGSVSAVNNGPSAGSDVGLGPVTTSGEQIYADPNGTTSVKANLTAANPITFYDSVVLNDGVNVDAGFGTVNFAGSGLQTLQSGTGATFGNLLHNGTGTLQLISGLTVQGTFETESGTFDANNQPVTVAGLTIVAGGSTYLAATAPQSFNGGLVILAGVFTSSTGPMRVSGGVILTGGQSSFGLLSGVGTVDTLRTLGGMLAPGGSSPGILSISGGLTLNLYTTVSILLNGTDPGTGYAQLQAGSPIDLGDSSLSLSIGFVPPLGSSFEILTNTGSAPITGTFVGLDEGAVFTQSGYQFQITYQGGTGGDSVVLTRLA
jgi:hypothetical protein